MKIRWSDLERGHQIVGGWTVVDLTATHITVSDNEGEMSTFRRKDPWEEVEIEAMSTVKIVEAFGGHVIREDVEGQPTTFFDWPDDPDFISAAQSHLIREHGTDPGSRSYEELRQLHEELHRMDPENYHHVHVKWMT